ncbi:hypothetical protein BC835DRAFT_854195 [Cytidiella melzeri]|nr:hypothetical protein BC835DRAFT_854195 [Cytidiella melzeri]
MDVLFFLLPNGSIHHGSGELRSTAPPIPTLDGIGDVCPFVEPNGAASHLAKGYKVLGACLYLRRNLDVIGTVAEATLLGECGGEAHARRDRHCLCRTMTRGEGLGPLCVTRLTLSSPCFGKKVEAGGGRQRRSGQLAHGETRKFNVRWSLPYREVGCTCLFGSYCCFGELFSIQSMNVDLSVPSTTGIKLHSRFHNCKGLKTGHFSLIIGLVLFQSSDKAYTQFCTNSSRCAPNDAVR